MQDDRWGSEWAEERLKKLGFPFKLETGLNREQALAVIKELAGVVVIPSLIENSPCAVEELLDSGLRIVTTDVGGTPELVEDGQSRWLSSADPIALAAHIEYALSDRGSSKYMLKAKVPTWEIALSWQAFHERLPRRTHASEGTSMKSKGERRYSFRPRDLASKIIRRVIGK